MTIARGRCVCAKRLRLRARSIAHPRSRPLAAPPAVGAKLRALSALVFAETKERLLWAAIDATTCTSGASRASIVLDNALAFDAMQRGCVASRRVASRARAGMQTRV